MWDAETGRERGDLRGHTEQINSISWRGDSAVLASTSEDDTVRLWKVADSTQIKSWSAHIPGSNSVHFARDGQLVSAGRDAVVKTWKADGAAIRDAGKLEDLALAARFTHDGKRIVAADWKGNVRVFDAESGAEVATLDPNPPTIDARLAATESEVNALRAGSQQAQEQLTAAQQQVAAAESALEAARKDAAAKTQTQAEMTANLGTAEERLASVAKEKAAVAEAAAKIAAEIAATKDELAAAEAAVKAKQAERDEAKAGVTKQETFVQELAAQLAALQKSLEEAQASLTAMAAAHAAKEHEAAGADAKVGELQGKAAELERRQAELEAIGKLREQFGVSK